MQGLLQKLLQRKLLLLSLLVNLILVLVCLVLFAELRKSYTNYRHFRALSVGISEATSAEPTTDKTIVLYGDSRPPNLTSTASLTLALPEKPPVKCDDVLSAM